MDELLALSHDDETQELTEFYENNLEILKTCPVYTLQPNVLKTVAVMLHSKFYYDSDWQGYASEMGVTDNLLLGTIQESAKMTKELPLFITMRNTLDTLNGNLAIIVKAFLNFKRYDALSFLVPFVKKIIEKRPDTEVKDCVIGEERLLYKGNRSSAFSSGTTDDGICEIVTSLYSACTEQSEKAFTSEFDPVFTKKHTAFELNALSKNSDCRYPISELNLYSSSNLSKLSCEENSLQELKLPSAPPQEILSVLIPHAEKDIEIARQLCQKLQEGGLGAKILSDMEMVIRMDPTGALNKIFQEVDFIVPVVSEEFLQQIDPQFCGDFDAVNNRTLYQLITNEYQYNGSVNYRVRPVLVPDMKRSLKLTNNVILCYSFRLWNECEKLIRILKETKELMKYYPLKMKAKA